MAFGMISSFVKAYEASFAITYFRNVFAAFEHFGREDLGVKFERTDKAAALRAAIDR
jgi:S-adenosylmethionine synthetase